MGRAGCVTLKSWFKCVVQGEFTRLITGTLCQAGNLGRGVDFIILFPYDNTLK